MYVVMCEIYKLEEGDYTLISAHPIEAVKNKREVSAWMYREPEIIVKYIQGVLETTYSIAERDEKHAVIVNTDGTEKRIYIPRKV